MWAGQWLLSGSAYSQTSWDGRPGSLVPLPHTLTVTDILLSPAEVATTGVSTVAAVRNGKCGTGLGGKGVSMAAFPDLGGKGSDGLSDMDLLEGIYVDPGPRISFSFCFHMESVYSSSDFKREILPLVCAVHSAVHPAPFGAGLSKDSFSFSCIASPLQDHGLLRRSQVH